MLCKWKSIVKKLRGSWTVEILGEDNQLTWESVGLTMTVAQIYEDVLNVGQ
ncbi:protein of unknown function [Limnospira indica PCC 8005]|uniref:Uncharacterized protein n=1 Tax=Limnospira indica PCC 8005 TaxID=376219 RepID=A0A9P1NYL3_9CYAN|nr:protein of unknown function [Limnospira indica PCC 8005]